MPILEISPPLATLLAALIGAVLLLYVHRKNARRAAAAKYRAALLRSFIGLYPIASDWPKDIDSHLRKIFPEVQAAIAEFRPFVPWYKRSSFDRAWFSYRLGEDGREIDRQLYHQYMGFLGADGKGVDPRSIFRSKVDRLMSFAPDV